MQRKRRRRKLMSRRLSIIGIACTAAVVGLIYLGNNAGRQSVATPEPATVGHIGTSKPTDSNAVADLEKLLVDVPAPPVAPDPEPLTFIARNGETVTLSLNVTKMLQDDVDDDYLNTLCCGAKMLMGEAYGTPEDPLCPVYHQLLVCTVFLNRIASDIYPNDPYEVLEQPKQYSIDYTHGFSSITDHYYEIMIRAMAGEAEAPTNLVFQANFVQGPVFYESYVESPWFSSTTYFCTSEFA